MSKLLKLYILDMCTVLYINYISKRLLFFFAAGAGVVFFPGGSDSKESAYSARNPNLLPGSGRSPGE